MNILDHTWGISAAQDRVWAEVSGLRTSETGTRLFVALQAFIDESFDKDVFVLAGCIAPVEAWANFSRDWEQALQGAILNDQGNFHFKMKEMAQKDVLMEKVPGFAHIIEDHVLGFVSAKISISDLKIIISSRISVPNVQIDWAMFGNPYFVTFRCLMDMFHLKRDLMTEAIPLNEQIDFYFDKRSEAGIIYSSWENYMNERPDETRKYYGATPVFRDDAQFLPLQAADFWAWWVRKWYSGGTPEKIPKRDFGWPKPNRNKKYLNIDISFDQDQLATVMKRIVRTHVGPDRPIYDVKFS